MIISPKTIEKLRTLINEETEMSYNFRPDQHTAKICFQVLKAALYQIESKSKSL